ncbi:uncharacterized protein LOC132191328 [Corylus avellana]|uniref:uncharacterized protein LOC132191328 n=1 Tax=Corylus avellana TaxID=13451 RepID=UPI00286C78BE|nr:uncharacterized protein LOC132191328 [Corylus avellana]
MKKGCWKPGTVAQIGANLRTGCLSGETSVPPANLQFRQHPWSQLKLAEPRFLRFANSLLKIADPAAGSPSTLQQRPAASAIANPRHRQSATWFALRDRQPFFLFFRLPSLTLAHHHRTRV